MRVLIFSVCRFFQLLPERLAIGIGLFLGWFLRYVLRHRYAIVMNQLQVAYGRSKSSAELRRIANGIYRHMGLLIIESLRLPCLACGKLDERFEFEGIEHLDAALKRGKGVFLLTGHIGNWELGGKALVERGYEVYAIYKELKTPAGEAFRKMVREEIGVHSIPRHNSTKQILSVLRKNGIIVFILDQNMTAKEGTFVDFFGVPACTMAGLAILAERTGSAVIPACSYRAPDLRHHHLTMLPAIDLEKVSEDRQENANHNTGRFTKFIEDFINRQPDQWIWIHKRWKTRPVGETASPFIY